MATDYYHISLTTDVVGIESAVALKNGYALGIALTIGLNQWKDQASTAGGQAIQNLVITGSLITIIPLVIAFLCLQKYWQSGLAAGAIKE